MKNLLLLLSLSILPFGAYAQNFQWARGFGSTGMDNGYAITTDASGNVYTTGSYTGTIDLDPGMGSFNVTSAGNADIFISKLDVSGNFVWGRSMGGTFIDEGSAITIDDSMNIYITGDFTETVDFDPGPGVFSMTSAGDHDIFISKLDPLGNFLWAKRIGSTYREGTTSIVLDKSGNIFTAGWFNGDVDFDPNAGMFKMYNGGAFVLKLNNSGDFVWAKSFGVDPGKAVVFAMALDAGGNIYTTGYFYATANFNPGSGTDELISAGNQDIFVSKLDNMGNFLWAKSFGSKFSESCHAIGVDNMGNVYTSGTFMDTCDFDPGPSVHNLVSAGRDDIFISKLDAYGNFVWVKQLGSTNDDRPYALKLDAAGNLYTTGSFYATVDFDPGAGTFNMTSAGLNDIYILKLDAAGNFAWAKRIGGTLSEQGNALCIDVAGTVYVSGYFSGTVDFDPGAGTSNLIAKGAWDSFVMKLGNFGVGFNDDILKQEFTLYPNPANNEIKISGNHATVGLNYNITDAIGRQVLSGSLNNELNSIDISGLAKGFYFVILGERKEIFKLLVEFH